MKDHTDVSVAEDQMEVAWTEAGWRGGEEKVPIFFGIWLSTRSGGPMSDPTHLRRGVWYEISCYKLPRKQGVSLHCCGIPGRKRRRERLEKEKMGGKDAFLKVKAFGFLSCPHLITSLIFLPIPTNKQTNKTDQTLELWESSEQYIHGSELGGRDSGRGCTAGFPCPASQCAKMLVGPPRDSTEALRWAESPRGLVFWLGKRHRFHKDFS